MRVIVLNLTRRTDRRDNCIKEFTKFGFKNVEWISSWDADNFTTTQSVVQHTRNNPTARVWFQDYDVDSHIKKLASNSVAEHNADFNASANKRLIAKVCCSETHRTAWCKVAEGDDDWALIMEDDFNLCRDYSTLETPPDDCQYPIWSLGRHKWADKLGMNGLDAYVIHKRTAKALIQHLDICVEDRHYWRTRLSPDDGMYEAVEQGLFKPKVGTPLITMWNSKSDIERFDDIPPPQGVNEMDLQIHLQNLANQGTLTIAIGCTDTEAVKIGFWNDCIVKERNANILTFYKRTPPMPQRPWQDEFIKTLPTVTQSIKDLPAVDPDGNLITDISGYIADVTKFDNRRR